MARAKTYTSTGSYTRYDRVLPGSDAFRGADYKDEAGLVDQTRLAFCRNMWKDYDASEVGGIESFPGFRLWHTCIGADGKANGLWYATIRSQNVFIAHIGNKLYIIGEDGTLKKTESGFADRKSSAFMFNNKFYLLDGSKYWVVDYANNAFSASEITSGYHPITYIDNLEYEQRNMLDNHFVEKWNIPTAEASCQAGNLGLTYGTTSGTTIPVSGTVSTKRVLYIPGSISYNGNAYDTINISSSAFYGNTMLETVVLEKVHDIGSNAFADCTNLKRVVIKEITGSISSSAFSGCSKLLNIYIDIANTTSAVTLTGVASDLTINYKVNGNIDATPTPRKKDCDVAVMFAGQSATFEIPTGEAFNQINPYDNYADLKSATIGDNDVTVESYKPTVAACRAYESGTSNDRILCVVALSPEGDLVDYDSVFAKSISSYSSSAGNSVFATDGRCDFYISTPCESYTEVRLIGGAFGSTGLPLHTTSKTNGVIYNTVIDSVTGYHSIIRLYAEDLSVLNDTVLQLKGTAVASTFSTSGYADYASASGYTGTSLAAIKGCRISCVFDGRPFFSGNPNLPNTVFYASRRSDTGVIDPTYIGVCNFFNDGTGNAQNVALMGGSDTLFVFKNKSLVNGSVFYHTPRETGMNFLPKDYPATEGAKDHDCVGACCNFRDDYVFLTKRGVDGVDKAQLNLERTIGHRSSMVDTLLIGKNLSTAQMIEWKEWLLLSVDGEVLMADSRQMFQNLDTVEYEWFRLTDVGGHINDRDVFRYASGGYLENYPAVPIEEWSIDDPGFEGQHLRIKRVENYADEVFDYQHVRVTNNDGDEEFVFVDSEGYLVVQTEERAGGTLRPARYMCTRNTGTDEELYFLTDDGIIYKVNTDMRGYSLCEEAMEFPDNETLYFWYPDDNIYLPLHLSETGTEHWLKDKTMAYRRLGENYVEYGLVYTYRYGDLTQVYFCDEPFYTVGEKDIDPYWYTYDNHSYSCEIATRYDDCGSPHLSKNTIKNSVAITAKTFRRSAFDVLARSERKEWKKIETVDASHGDFTETDFAAYSFRSRREYIYRSDEYLKKWVRKQYDFKNDCYRKPFGIYSIAFGYYIHGKVQF